MQAVEFTFSRDWIHAGIEYRAGDKAPLPGCDANMLAEAGAGEMRRPDDERSRRKPKSQPDPE